MTSSPFRDAPGAMAEERRLRIASAPSTVCLHGTHDGTPGGCASWMPRWQINVNVNVSSNREENELKSCENPLYQYRLEYSCNIARSHLRTATPPGWPRY